VRQVVDRHRPTHWIEGTDFRFGKGRAGDNRTLESMERACGFRTVVVDPVLGLLTDQSEVVVSSSLVRWLVAHGRVSDASRLLGRPYEIEGVIVRGDQRGRTIGCPTANLETEHLLPLDGVYAGCARLSDGREFDAAISVGDKPTFHGSARACEAHLLDWRGPLAEGAPEYGWGLALRFEAWLRDQVRYDGVGPLVEQISRDLQNTRRVRRPAAAPALQESNA